MFGIFSKKKKPVESNAQYYDDMYRTGGHLGQYHVHYTESRYFPVWSRGADIILSIDNPRVLDIGCGPGQFAHMLFNRGITSYTGIDYSSEAIILAQKNVPKWAENFAVANVLSMGAFPENIDIVTMFEVLEHLERDLDLLKLIPAGTKVLFSVPSYGSASHVRQFKTAGKVKKRYQPFVDFIEFESFHDCPETGKTIYLVHGTIKYSQD